MPKFWISAGSTILKMPVVAHQCNYELNHVNIQKVQILIVYGENWFGIKI